VRRQYEQYPSHDVSNRRRASDLQIVAVGGEQTSSVSWLHPTRDDTIKSGNHGLGPISRQDGWMLDQTSSGGPGVVLVWNGYRFCAIPGGELVLWEAARVTGGQPVYYAGDCLKLQSRKVMGVDIYSSLFPDGGKRVAVGGSLWHGGHLECPKLFITLCTTP
jgi:hypothetical protein